MFGISDDHPGAAELALLTFRAIIPPSLGFVDAAGLPVALETATRALDQLGVASGSTLFIKGASGDFDGAKEHGVHFSNGFAGGHAFHALAAIAEAHRISEHGRVRGRLVLMVG